MPRLNLTRQTLAGLTSADWMENIYSGWLWAIQPLWSRDPAAYPDHDANRGLAVSAISRPDWAATRS